MDNNQPTPEAITLSSDKAIAYRPELAKYLNSLTTAIYFQQLSHWQKYAKREDGFIYKSAKEIEDETFISPMKQRKCRTDLEARGWIEIKKIMANGAPTLHFKVLVNLFTDVRFVITTNRLVQNNKSITKNTTQERKYTAEMLTNIEKVYDIWLKLMVVDPAIRVHGTTDEKRAALSKAHTRTRLTDLRKTKIAARLKSFGPLEEGASHPVISAIRSLAQSEFHRGDNDRGWKASLEWFMEKDERIEEWANKGGAA